MLDTPHQRVTHMEELFDVLQAAWSADPIGFRHSEPLQQMLRELTAYYENGQWLQDYTLDEQGYFPSDMKRGILSQDGFYNFLADLHTDNVSAAEPLPQGGVIRKATQEDLDAVDGIYQRIHTDQEQGNTVIGWQRGIYPTRHTAEQALLREDLFVQTDREGRIVGAAIFNQRQDDFYYGAPWQYPAADHQVMVMHTLVTDPAVKGQGYGSAFARFYEEYALSQGCHYLHIDTNERNLTARSFYRNRGYREIGVCPCDFNGLQGVRLVLLEKKI